MFYAVEIDSGSVGVFDSSDVRITPAKDSTIVASNVILTAIKDTDGIKKIVDALPTGDNTIGRVKLTDGTNVMGISSGGMGKVVLYDDVNNVALAAADGVAIPANTRGFMIMGQDADNHSHFLHIEDDGVLKVAARPPVAPAGTTEFILSVPDGSLSIGAPPVYHDAESAVIANGANLYLQSFTAGAAGDPTEKGSRVDLLWKEGAGPTYHTIDRMYVAGQSVTLVLPDTHEARDGTVLTGNGSNTRLVLRRYRLSNASQEVDGIIRGYTS
jgi:hypothetical protein